MANRRIKSWYTIVSILCRLQKAMVYSHGSLSFKKNTLHSFDEDCLETPFCVSFKKDGVSSTAIREETKDELHYAGLGENLVEFNSLKMSGEEFKELLVSYFPKLNDCGGYQLCQSINAKGDLEPLSTMSCCSPEILKQRCGSKRKYIVPIQQDLDLSSVHDAPNNV